LSKSRVAILALCAAAMSVAACADILGFKPLRPGDAGPPDVGQPDGFVDPCPHARWPGPPDASDPGTKNDYVLALQHVYFSSTLDGGTPAYGYDLDQKCTVDQASASCQSSALVTDGLGGVDNASITLMSSLSTLQPPLSDTAVNKTIADGKYTMVLQVRGLTSLVNQGSTTGLKLAVQASPGMENGGPATFDGTDRWLVADEDTVGGGSNYPKTFSPAYVNHGVFVATNPGQLSFRILIPTGNSVSGPVLVTLNQPVLTAKLEPFGDAGAVQMVSGVIAGRWSTSDMLDSLAQLTASGQALCDYLGGNAFNIVKSTICPLRDINAAGSDDGTSTCDAISVAISFDAVPAQIATTPVPFPVSTTPCGHDAGACDD
jgi:hypothetical protein